MIMTGRDLIRWIQDNKAEDLPVMIRRPGEQKKEIIEKEDLEIKISIAGNDNQLTYKKYFLI